MNSEISSSPQETRCQKKTREYTSAVFFLPVLFFAFDLAQAKWVNSENGIEEGFNLHWKHPTYFIVASLSGAIGGSVHTLYPGSARNEWAAGALGGFVASFCGLGASVLFLNSVTSTPKFVLILIAVIAGGIPGCLAYNIVMKKFINPEHDVLHTNLATNAEVV